MNLLRMILFWRRATILLFLLAADGEYLVDDNGDWLIAR